MSGKAMLAVKGLSRRFPLPGRDLQGMPRMLTAVNNVTLEIDKGEILGLVGESGCGKSTLGRCCLRLIEPTEGSVLLDGEDITHIRPAKLRHMRRRMQMVFQNPLSSFNPKMTIGQTLQEVCHVHGIKGSEAEQGIRELLQKIALPEDVLDRRPVELSGGQLQRLAIARVLLLKPDFILADEPVSALDVSVQAQILNLLMDLRQDFDMTMLFISHELTVVEHICDRVGVMYLGSIVELAPAEELFQNITHPYTQALMSAIPRSHPDEEKQRVLLEGDIPNPIDAPPEGCRFAARCPKCTPICKMQTPVLKEIFPDHFVACFAVPEGA